MITLIIKCALGAFTLTAPADMVPTMTQPAVLSAFCSDPARYGAPVPAAATVRALRDEVERLLEEAR